MNTRTAFTIAVVGAGIYALYKNAQKRSEQQKQQQQAKADWENEGGAPVTEPSPG